MSSGLLRYRSAPSALFGDVCEDFLPVRPSSPDTETMFARFLAAPERNAHYTQPPTTTEILPTQPHSRMEFSGQQMMHHPHHHHHHQQMPNHSHNWDVHLRAPTRTEQIKIEDDGNELVRHSSSPTGLFSHLEVDNGLKHQLSFSSQTPSFRTSLWDDSPPLSNSFTGLKRPRESDLGAKLLAGLNMQSELQIQDSVLCKMRAKRGCATHPRSIAERVRRTRISERMRKLQELVPSMDKQTNTSDMLDLAVEHIKDLQEQVKRLSEIRASCTCCSKRIRYSNTGV